MLVDWGSPPGLAALYPPHSLPDLQILEQAQAEVLPTAGDGLLPWLDRSPQIDEPIRSAPS